MAKPMFKRDEEDGVEETVIDEMETIIGPSVKVEGNFESNGDIAIEGSVKGTITTTKDLRIGESAVIEADIVANNIITSGQISGTIQAKDTLDLKTTGRIVGDVQAKTLSVETGAVLQGNCASGQQAAAQAQAKNGNRRAGKEEKNEEEA